MSRSFAKLLASYKTYDPEVEGFGSPAKWKTAFRDRMNLGQARDALRGRCPRTVLGVPPNATWAEVTKAFRKRMLEVHPDRCQVTGLPPEDAHRLSQEAVAAYSVLADKFAR